MTELDLKCKRCRKHFECDVGRITFPAKSRRPHFERDIICPKCGSISMNDVELTELGQTQLSSVFMSRME